MRDPVQPLTPEQEAVQEQDAAREGYLHRVIEELDVLGNTLADGKQNETISSRLAREDKNGHGFAHEVGELGSEILDEFQKNHGAKAVAADLERAKAIEKLEEDSGIVPKGGD